MFLNKFTKRDLGFAVLTGAITGLIAWRIFEFLGVPRFGFGHSGSICFNIDNCSRIYTNAISWEWLVLIIPILWILGVLVGYFLGQWLKFFDQFGKFVAIGFTNAAVDFGILNVLISATGITQGTGYALFKTVSFLGALILSYIWNKYWAFRRESNPSTSSGSSSGGGGGEFLKFFSVAVISLLVNVAVASVVVNFVHPILGFDAKTWANLSAVAGSAVALVFSFVGFRVAVFK